MNLIRRLVWCASLAVLAFLANGSRLQAGVLSVKVFEVTDALGTVHVSCIEQVTIVAYDSKGKSLGTWNTVNGLATVICTSGEADKSVKLTFKRLSSATVNLEIEGVYMNFTPVLPAKAMDVVMPKPSHVPTPVMGPHPVMPGVVCTVGTPYCEPVVPCCECQPRCGGRRLFGRLRCR